jgi:hypothetical protein
MMRRWGVNQQRRKETKKRRNRLWYVGEMEFGMMDDTLINGL